MWENFTGRRELRPVDLTFDRPILHARIEPPGGAPLHLLNLHLRAPRAAFLPGGREEGRWRSLSHWAEAYYLAGLKRQGQALEARLDTVSCSTVRPACSSSRRIC